MGPFLVFSSLPWSSGGGQAIPRVTTRSERSGGGVRARSQTGDRKEEDADLDSPGSATVSARFCSPQVALLAAMADSNWFQCLLVMPASIVLIVLRLCFIFMMLVPWTVHVERS